MTCGHISIIKHGADGKFVRPIFMTEKKQRERVTKKPRYCHQSEIWNQDLYILQSYAVRDKNGNEGRAYILREPLQSYQREYFSTFPNVDFRTCTAVNVPNRVYDVIIIKEPV